MSTRGDAATRRRYAIAQIGGSAPSPMSGCRGSGSTHAAHELADEEGKPLQVIHRDVSPQNVFVTFDGEVKLIDFGIARFADRLARTRSGVVKGKFAYMAPEQFHCEPLDRRTDVFAAGVVLHELLTEEPISERRARVQSSSRALLVVAGAALGIAALGAAGYGWGLGAPAPTAPPTAPPIASPPRPEPAPPSAVRVTIETIPPGATARIAGEPRGVTPLVLELPRQSARLELALEHEGYVPMTQTLVPDQSQRLLFQLAPRDR